MQIELEKITKAWSEVATSRDAARWVCSHSTGAVPECGLDNLVLRVHPEKINLADSGLMVEAR